MRPLASRTATRRGSAYHEASDHRTISRPICPAPSEYRAPKTRMTKGPPHYIYATRPCLFSGQGEEREKEKEFALPTPTMVATPLARVKQLYKLLTTRQSSTSRGLPHLNFAPSELGATGVFVIAVCIVVKTVGAFLGLTSSSWSVVKDVNVNIRELPRLEITHPLRVTLAMQQGVEGVISSMRRLPTGKLSSSSQASPLLFAVPIYRLMILLLSYQYCPLLPLGVLHSRNRSELLEPDASRDSNHAHGHGHAHSDQQCMASLEARRTPLAEFAQASGSISTSKSSADRRICLQILHQFTLPSDPTGHHHVLAFTQARA